MSSSYIRTERGGASIELTLITPLLLVLLMFVITAGRLVDTRMRVDDAAHDAARAASIARNPSSAGLAAQSSANATLGQGDSGCRNMAVSTETNQFHAGGSVSVDLTCNVDLSDLSLLRLPGSRTITTRATAVVDTFRSVQ